VNTITRIRTRPRGIRLTLIIIALNRDDRMMRVRFRARATVVPNALENMLTMYIVQYVNIIIVIYCHANEIISYEHPCGRENVTGLTLLNNVLLASGR
jgi:hypothetical protein